VPDPSSPPQIIRFSSQFTLRLLPDLARKLIHRLDCCNCLVCSSAHRGQQSTVSKCSLLALHCAFLHLTPSLSHFARNSFTDYSTFSAQRRAHASSRSIRAHCARTFKPPTKPHPHSQTLPANSFTDLTVAFGSYSDFTSAHSVRKRGLFTSGGTY
jgi:hypothetical protein